MRRSSLVAVVLGLVVAGELVACKGGGRRVRRDHDAAVGTVAPGQGGGGAAASTQEVEPNDAPEQATVVAPGTVVRGTLDGERDVDLYKVTVPSAGQLGLALTGIEGVDLVLELRDATGAVIAKSDHGPAKSGEGMPNVGVLPGDYVVAVKEFVKPRKKPKPAPRSKKGKKDAKGTATPPPDAAPVEEGRTGPSPVYELTVQLAAQPEALHEVEPDDDPGTAVEVLLADTVHGWIGWTGDVDLWKLSLEGVSEPYAIDVDVSGLDGVALSVDVLDAGGKVLLSRKGAKGGAIEIRGMVPVLAEAAPPWHFVRISGDRSNPDQAYELRFTTRLREADEEAEPNDTPERATALRPDPSVASAGSGNGAMRATWAASDVDRFRLGAVAEPSLVDVTVEPPTQGATVVDVTVEVGLAGQPPLASASSSGAGSKAHLAGVAVPAGADPIVTVKAKSSKRADAAATGGALPYRLTWSLAPATGDPLPPEEVAPGAPPPPAGPDGGTP